MTSHGVQCQVKKRPMRLPGAGTKRRQMLAHMILTGLTAPQAIKLGLTNHASGGLTAALHAFEDELFFDVRYIKTKHMKHMTYFVVGRWDANGDYIDYLARRIK